LEYEPLAEINPRIITCFISGFGSTGSRSDWLAYDTIVQASSGIMMQNSLDGRTPRASRPAVADYFSAFHAALAILQAYYQQKETGRGQNIEVSMLDVLMSVIWSEAPDHPYDEKQPARPANGHPRTVPWNTYATVDGYVSIAASKEVQWQKLVDIMGLEQFRHLGKTDRVVHRHEIDEAIGEWTHTRRKREIADQLQAAGVPSSPVLSELEAAEEVNVRERGVIEQVITPGTGVPSAHRMARFPVRFSDLETPTGRAPLLGEHNSLVFGDYLGFDQDVLTDLAQRGII